MLTPAGRVKVTMNSFTVGPFQIGAPKLTPGIPQLGSTIPPPSPLYAKGWPVCIVPLPPDPLIGMLPAKATEVRATRQTIRNVLRSIRLPPVLGGHWGAYTQTAQGEKQNLKNWYRERRDAGTASARRFVWGHRVSVSTSTGRLTKI